MPSELQAQQTPRSDIPDELGLLRPAASRWHSILGGFAFQAVLCTLLANVMFFEFVRAEPEQKYVTTEVFLPPEPSESVPPRPRIDIQPPPVEHFEARIRRPELTAPLEKPLPAAPSIQSALPQSAPNLPLPKTPAIPKLKEQLRTNVFAGSSAAPTLNLPASKVQTGGFGDPNGVPANPNAHGALEIAQVGSFDLPAGGGRGNGTAGTHGVPGTVASAGFGNGVAVGNHKPNDGPGGVVRDAGFREMTTAAREPQKSAAAKPTTIPAEILSKPQPIYTSEAREKRIEGEVLLDVLLGADGHIRVLRVVQSLGAGLDENAVRAAQGIVFKPAYRNGQPIDSTARVHITFRLA